MNLKLSVKTLREGSLEAKWGKTSNGAPAMFARNPNGAHHQRKSWWLVDKGMWTAMQRDGVVEGFNNHTALGDYFSIPA